MADIFISYSSHDKAFAERLYRELERFNVHGFMDSSDLAAGSEWSTHLKETVRNADAVLLILSRYAARSNWVLAEIGLADTLGKKVIPVLAPGESYEEAVPPFLLDRLAIDANRLPLEEVAARVVATVTDTPIEVALNEVRSRSRRRVRIFTLATAAFAALAIMSAVFAIVALQNKREAEARRARLEQLTGQSGALAIAPDGNTFAAGSQSGEVILWDAKSGERLASLRGGQGVISALAFSPDARLLATGSWDGTITIWDPTSKKLVRRLEGHKKAVTTVQFSPDGQQLYARSVDGAIREWRLPDGVLLRTFDAPS